jgi:hypothetical protein
VEIGVLEVHKDQQVFKVHKAILAYKAIKDHRVLPVSMV